MRPFPSGALLAVLALACAHPPSGPPGQPLDRLESVRAAARAVSPRGRPRVIHFWALWCSACMEELPAQVEWAGRARAAGADVLFVDLDGFDKEAAVRAHLASLGAFAVAEQAMLETSLDTQEVTRLLSPRWTGILPSTFVRRADGSLAAEVIGPATPDALERAFRAISGQSPPAAPPKEL